MTLRPDPHRHARENEKDIPRRLLSQEETGRQLGISRQRVAQIEEQALNKMRSEWARLFGPLSMEAWE